MRCKGSGRTAAILWGAASSLREYIFVIMSVCVKFSSVCEKFGSVLFERARVCMCVCVCEVRLYLK